MRDATSTPLTTFTGLDGLGLQTVERRGFEPLTYGLQSRRSTN